jgi:Tfp pilus assembly protein PilF/NAD-dependent dihydropyrimidine dehydrogenase PreA subunit
VLDPLSPMRVRVTDACEQCGHCTATCTSNVRVHEEVRRFGMVVDPGCMKCTDCVSVCPMNALYVGFGRPSLFRGRSAAPASERMFALRLPEELLLGLVFLVSLLTFRGLYDGPPLLMAVGLAGVTAFCVLQLVRLVRRPTVRLQNLNLKLGGQVRTSGRLFAVFAVLWLLFTAHSAFVQWHRAWGRHHLNRTQAGRADVLEGDYDPAHHTEAHRRAAERSFRHFEHAERWGLADVLEIRLGLAWGHLLRGETAEAETELRAAIVLAPDRRELHEDLFQVLVGQGRAEDALQVRLDWIETGSPSADDHAGAAELLAQAGRAEEAVERYRVAVAAGASSLDVHYNLGGLLRRLERPDEALEPLERAHELAPEDVDTLIELALARIAVGEGGDALPLLRRAVELDPDSPESRLYLTPLIGDLERGTP